MKSAVICAKEKERRKLNFPMCLFQGMPEMTRRLPS